MINVGIIGLGFMGKIHLKSYMENEKSRVVALCDLNKERIGGDDSPLGNIQPNVREKIDFSQFKLYVNIDEIISDKSIDVIDICLPSDMNAEVAIKSMKAGKNVLCEKPIALTIEEGRRIIETARTEKVIFMVAHVIRFWPEYMYLTKIIQDKTLGKLQSLLFSRLISHPTYSQGNWLLDEKRSGGAIFNLHIHDVDYLVSLFGKPKSVVSQGIYEKGKGYSHVVTQYFYPEIPVVTAVGGWMMPEGFAFTMSFNAIFERGALIYDSSSIPTLIEITDGRKSLVNDLLPGDGYSREIDYFLECVDRGVEPELCMPESNLDSLEVVMDELNYLKKSG